VCEADESLNGVLVAFEDGFDCPVPPIRDPARDAVPLREPTRRVAEEDALHAAVNNDAAANHGAYSPRRWSSVTSSNADGSYVHIPASRFRA
jgi:hypothetical protein